MPDPADLIPIQRLGLGVLVMFGWFILTFFVAVLWINISTGEPVIFSALEHGEARVELLLLLGLSGIAAYGMVIFDWILRGRDGDD